MILHITDFKIKTKIGIYDYENYIDRELVINLKIKTKDFNSNDEDIANILDYDLIIERINKIIKLKRYKLIEKLAFDITNDISKIDLVDNIMIRIDKMNIYDNIESCGVEMELFNKW